MKTLVIVESSCVGATYTGKAAQFLGYKPVSLADEHGSQGETRERMEAFDVLKCDTTSIERMAVELNRAGVTDVGVVVSLCDTKIMSAVEFAEALGVRSISATARTLKDKGNVFSLVPEFSQPSVVFDAQRIPYLELSELCKTSKRLIFKACCSSGGLGSFALEAIDRATLGAMAATRLGVVPRPTGPFCAHRSQIGHGTVHTLPRLPGSRTPRRPGHRSA